MDVKNRTQARKRPTRNPGPTRAPAPASPRLTLILAVMFLVMLALGLFLGNVFETYHTGSSL